MEINTLSPRAVTNRWCQSNHLQTAKIDSDIRIRNKQTVGSIILNPVFGFFLNSTTPRHFRRFTASKDELQGGFDVWFSNNVHSVTWNAIFLYFVEITEQNHEQPHYNNSYGGYNRTPWDINCGGIRPVGQHRGKCSGTNSISATYGQPSVYRHKTTTKPTL